MKNKSVFFKTNLIYFIILAGLVAVRVVANLGLLGFMGEYGNYLLNLFLQVGLMFLLPVLLLSKFNGQKVRKTFKDFNFRKINFKAILISVLIGIIVFFLNLVISTIFSAIISIFGYESSSSGATSGLQSYPFWLFLITLLFSAVLPALCEETTHRGLLLNGYRQLGMKKAIIFTSLLFGLMHMNIEQFFYASLMGALFAFLTISTGSIVPAIIVHFMNNAISTYISYANFNGYFMGGFYSRLSAMFSQGFGVALSLIFVVVLISVLMLALLIYLLIKQTKVKKVQTIADRIAKNELKNNLFEGIEDAPKVESELHYEKEIKIVGDKHMVRLAIDIEDFNYPLKMVEKPSLFDKIFFYANIFLGVVITISTFIWGIL